MTACPAQRLRATDRGTDRGSALLTVLGAVAVLAAIGFATAAVARNALDRASVRADSNQAYFLARGGIEAALHEMSVRIGQKQPLPSGSHLRRYEFAGGIVEVSTVPENGKINVNRANRDSLGALMQSIGVAGGNAGLLADRILEYRGGLRNGLPRRFAPVDPEAADRRALSSFQRRAASIQMIEELLSVRGITPDLVYGRFEPVRVANGGSRGLRRIGGLLRFLRTRGSAMVDVNAASREVLIAAGLPPTLGDRLIAARRAHPIRRGDPLLDEAARHGSRIPLVASGDASGWMLTATAQLSEGRATRSVTAIVTAEGPDPGIRIARWYERAL